MSLALNSVHMAIIEYLYDLTVNITSMLTEKSCAQEHVIRIQFRDDGIRNLRVLSAENDNLLLGLY